MRQTKMELARRILVPCAISAGMVLGNPDLRAQTSPAAGGSVGPGGGDAAARDYLSANGLLSRGMDELAAQEYRKFLTQHPDHEKAALARYGLGVALFRMKKFDQALNELGQIKPDATFDFAAETLLLTGQADLELKKYSEAAAALQRVVDGFASHDLADDAAALLAEAAYRAGDLKGTIAASDVLVSKWPQSPLRERAEFFAGLAEVATPDAAAAGKRFSGWSERFPKAQFAAQANLLAAQSLHRAGELDAAERQYQLVMKQAGDAEQPLVADAMLGLASVWQQQAKADQAGKMLDEYLQRFPQHSGRGAALARRGRIQFDAGRYDLAAKAFGQAAQADPSLGDQSAYWLAKCELRQEHFEPAAAGLSDGIQRFPMSPLLPEMCYDRAVALMRAGDAKGAVAALAEFSSRFPDHALAGEAMFLQASLEHQQKKFDECRATLAAFNARGAAGDRAASAAFLGAENDLLQGRLDDAAAEFQRFLTEYPKDPQAEMARYRLASVLYRQKKLDEAALLLGPVLAGSKTAEPFRGGLLMLGDVHFQQGRWQKASQALTDYLSFGSAQPGADEAALKLGLSLERLKQPDQAQAVFTQLIESRKDGEPRLQAMFESGQIQLERGELDAAAALFSQVIEQGGASRFAPYALNHLAGIAMKRQDFAKAAELFAQGAKAGKGTDVEPEALFQRAQALMAAKDFNSADAAFAQFVAQFPAHERSAAAGAQHAIALARLDRHAQAIQAIDEVVKAKSGQLQPEVLATLQYEKAWCLRELGKADEAAAAYQALIAASPTMPIAANAMLELAELHAAAKRFKEAADVLSQLAGSIKDGSLMPSEQVRADALYRLAAARFELQQHAETIAACDAYIAANPDGQLLASAHMLAGESQFRLGQPALAEPRFAAVVEKFPDDPACGPCLLRLGECQAALQQWDQSEKSFTAYLGRFADSEVWFQARFGIGWALENQQRTDDAMAAYRAVVERHNGPTAARAQFQIGECLFAKKQLDEAVRELLKVDILYSYPEWSAAALYEAGRCLEQLGKPNDAAAQFEQVKRKYPQSRWADLAAQRMTALAKSSTPGG